MATELTLVEKLEKHFNEAAERYPHFALDFQVAIEINKHALGAKKEGEPMIPKALLIACAQDPEGHKARMDDPVFLEVQRQSHEIRRTHKGPLF